MLPCISSIGLSQRRGMYHIWIIGTNGAKVFFCDTDAVKGNFTEDICHISETDDFKFVYDFMANMLNDADLVEQIEASLVF